MAHSQKAPVGPKKPGTDKRSWSYEEELKLIEVLIEFRNEGKLRADKGLKPGQLAAIEERLKMKLPGCGINARPHIESKLRTFNKHFGIVHDMITGPNCSGFGWDSTRSCITAENAVWDEYLKSHPEANLFRFKSFPYYEELCIALGKDRAVGKNAETTIDAAEELEKQKENEDENDVAVSFSGGTSVFLQSEGTSKSKKQKIDVYDKIAAVMERSTDKMCQTLQSIEAVGSEKRSKVYDQLKLLSGLSVFQRHKAAVKIGCDHELIDVFFSIPDEEKEGFVVSLLD